MREIKFRVWDNEVKEMLRVTSHNFEIGMPSGCYMMQFTGLLDKKGKEIYEGDIIKTDDDEVKDICWIEWNNEYGKYVIQTKNGFLTNWVGCAYSLDDVEEVIGNIYENKDLLEK